MDPKKFGILTRQCILIWLALSWIQSDRSDTCRTQNPLDLFQSKISRKYQRTQWRIQFCPIKFFYFFFIFFICLVTEILEISQNLLSHSVFVPSWIVPRFAAEFGQIREVDFELQDHRVQSIYKLFIGMSKPSKRIKKRKKINLKNAKSKK